MKKILTFLLLIFIILVGCSEKSNQTKTLNIAVTIQPQIGIVKAIVGEVNSTITATIPPGNSPANYQPTPQELTKISDADVYFAIGVPAEQNILTKIVNQNTQIVSLLDAVIDEHGAKYMQAHEHDENQNHDSDSEGIDPHTWMSPKRVMTMVNTMVRTLSDIDPDHKEIYTTNGQSYITALEALDDEIREAIDHAKLEGFIIYHPSMGYFAEDYGLKMHVIEAGGKEATITSMTHIIDLAKKNNMTVIFYQEEFDSKQAKIIANEIGGQAVALDILSLDYIANMKKILQLLIS